MFRAATLLPRYNLLICGKSRSRPLFPDLSALSWSAGQPTLSYMERNVAPNIQGEKKTEKSQPKNPPLQIWDRNINIFQCLFVDSRTTINDVMDWAFVAFLCRWDYGRVREVFLVNNGWDDVRGLVMKSFIIHEDVAASVTRSQTHSPAPPKEHLAEVSLDIPSKSASCNSECRTWVSSVAD